jgi:1-acyl-sn-glycerol-3-phosphate acyltransferase
LLKSESIWVEYGNNLITGIRTLVVYVWVIMATVVLGMVAICLSLVSPTSDPVHLVARFWARSILFVSGISVEVRGISEIDPDRSYIYMSNHLSNFDIPVLLARLPVQFRWLAKAELFRIPLFGRAMRGAGYISIDRFNRKSAFASIEKAASRIQQGVSVMIFPEGTRSRDGCLQSFKKGGFVLAVDSKVPVVPLVIQGTQTIMPKGGRLIYPNPVVLQICRPIETTGYSRGTKEKLMARVRRVIRDQYAVNADGGGPC